MVQQGARLQLRQIRSVNQYTNLGYVRGRNGRQRNRANDKTFWKMIASGRPFKLDGTEYILSEAFIRNILDNRKDHYHECRIPKPSGGYRLLMVPNPILKALQRYILKRLHPFAIYETSHGFIRKRDIKTNADAHEMSRLLLHTDVKNFFPSVSPAIITRNLAHREDMKEWLGDKVAEFVQFVTFQNQIPQGAPTSPAIGNIVFRPIDASIKNYLVQGCDLTYTRYADNLVLSCPDVDQIQDSPDVSNKYYRNMSKLRKMTRHQMWRYMCWIGKVVNRYGFEINMEKTYVADKSRQMKVTGFVVNDSVNVPSKTINSLRAYAWKVKEMLKEGHTLAEDIERLRGLLAFMARSNGRSIKGTFLQNLLDIERMTGSKMVPARFKQE